MSLVHNFRSDGFAAMRGLTDSEVSGFGIDPGTLTVGTSRFELFGASLVYTGSDYAPGVWVNTKTTDAAEADALIRAHYGCSNIDTESRAFSCYDHSVSVLWIG